jgi:hypothetical protein
MVMAAADYFQTFWQEILVQARAAGKWAKTIEGVEGPKYNPVAIWGARTIVESGRFFCWRKA